MNYKVINFSEKFGLIDEQWQPKVIAEMNEYQFKLVRLQGDFIWHDHKETDETFIVIDGERWVIPGDMARVEADGSITLLGRGSVSINSGGEKIFPEEVELALKSHPDVFDVVVVGVPDERWGERVAAVVKPRGGATPDADALAAHARETIAGYKVPKEVHLVDEIVRSPSGKADYRWAKAQALGEG